MASACVRVYGQLLRILPASGMTSRGTPTSLCRTRRSAFNLPAARLLGVSLVFVRPKTIPLAHLTQRRTQARLNGGSRSSRSSAISNSNTIGCVAWCKRTMSSNATSTLSPRPPPGYAWLPASSTQILLPLTISNKCGQAFRWRGVDVYERIEDNVKIEANGYSYSNGTEVKVKKEESETLQPITSIEPASRPQPRYRKTTEWSMCIDDRVVFVRQDEERGFIYYTTQMASSSATTQDAERIQAETAAWLYDYLNLNVPLADLYEEWSAKDAVFKRFATRFSGVRMLRQDPWETLCAFICSSNNNIARIGQMVQNLCTHFSEPLLSITYPAPPADLFGPLSDDDVQYAPTTITYYPFPAVERLAGPDVDATLRALSFGYRSRYIQDTARMLLDVVQANDTVPSVDAYLHSLRTMSYSEARQELLQFPGVGPKVADCILLMAMDQPSSIPVDRHVFQFAERWYKIRTKGGHKGYEHIADAFRQLWGPYAGWAHSVLFTADLRAFQSYKVEGGAGIKKEEAVEVQKSDSGSVDSDSFLSLSTVVTTKRESALLAEEMLAKDEQTAVKEESPRAARWKKRIRHDTIKLEETRDMSSTLQQTFKGIKRPRNEPHRLNSKTQV